MTILCIDHVTIRTDRATETVRFYETFIGLKTGPRPDFGVPGHWLYAGDRPVVHIIGDDARSDALPAGSGRIDHIALRGSDAAAVRARLQAQGQAVREGVVPGSGDVQLFLTDPNGIRVELVFAADPD